MKFHHTFIPLCLAVTVGCGGSHSDSATTSGSGTQGAAGSMSGSNLSASATPYASMTGGNMSGSSMSGSMSGHHHHKRKETAMNGTDSSADGSASTTDGSTSGSMAGSGASAAGAPAHFSTEAAATAHCPSDTVVWLNLKTKVYHLKGTERYGTTKHGAYACETEANTAGDRAAK